MLFAKYATLLHKCFLELFHKSHFGNQLLLLKPVRQGIDLGIVEHDVYEGQWAVLPASSDVPTTALIEAVVLIKNGKLEARVQGKPGAECDQMGLQRLRCYSEITDAVVFVIRSHGDMYRRSQTQPRIDGGQLPVVEWPPNDAP